MTTTTCPRHLSLRADTFATRGLLADLLVRIRIVSLLFGSPYRQNPSEDDCEETPLPLRVLDGLDQPFSECPKNSWHLFPAVSLSPKPLHDERQSEDDLGTIRRPQRGLLKVGRGFPLAIEFEQEISAELICGNCGIGRLRQVVD